MDSSIIVEYRKQLSSLDFYWNILGFCPYKPHIPSCLGRYFNYAAFWCGCWLAFLAYTIAFEVDSLVVVAQMSFVVMGSIPVVTRTIHGIHYNKDSVTLIRWYESIIEDPIHLDYMPTMRKHLIKQNYAIKFLIAFNKLLMLTTAVVVVGTQVLTKTPSTPLQVNGQPLLGHHIITDLMIVLASVTRTAFAISGFIAYDGIFTIHVAILCTRFRCIGELLSLLDYAGTRDEERDARILRDFYFMHLELYQKAKLFIDCYKYYAVFHLGPPIASGTFLFYIFKAEGRVDLIFIMIIIVGTGQSLLYCYFGNMLNFESRQLPQNLYNTQWFALKSKEKKTILLLQYGTQMQIRFTAGGVYEMNLPLFVSIIKLQATFCAVLQAM